MLTDRKGSLRQGKILRRITEDFLHLVWLHAHFKAMQKTITSGEQFPPHLIVWEYELWKTRKEERRTAFDFSERMDTERLSFWLPSK